MLPNKKKSFSIVILILCIIFSISLIFIFTTKKPLASIGKFFSLPFSSSYFLGTFLNAASNLLFASLGAFLALVSGNLNLGGQGQIYLGGFLAALLLQHQQIPAFFSLCLVFFATGCIGLIVGILKNNKGINELLSSFLLSSASIPLIDYCITTPFRDTQSNLIATKPIAEIFQFTSLFPPSHLNGSIFIALALWFGIFLILTKTSFGKIFKLCGTAPEFSCYMGYSVKKNDMLGLILSSGFHGLCGYFAIRGTYHVCFTNFYGEIGWNGLSVALLANGNPLILLIANFVLSYFFAACEFLTITNTLQFDLSFILQGFIFLLISAKSFSFNFKYKKGIPS
ncbi:MAG: ABC transporter permease [Spirochaetaceae bacterium]|nr:ABC transporter permease [Spirochaetaceae bacterium]